MFGARGLNLQFSKDAINITNFSTITLKQTTCLSRTTEAHKFQKARDGQTIANN